MVVVADLQADKGEALAEEIGGVFVAGRRHRHRADQGRRRRRPPSSARCGSWSTPPASAGRSARSAGTASSTPRTTSSAFKKVIAINLIGTFDVIRLAATEMSKLEPDDDRRARRDRQPRHRRGVRRPDRPGGVLRLQGRRRRHDPPGRPRPVRRRHPAQHRRARPDRHPDLRRGRGRRRRSRPSSARACCSPSGSATPRSSRRWWSSA